MERALQSAFGLNDLSHDIPAAGRTDRAITADLFRFHGIPESAETRRRFLAAYLDHLPGMLAELRGRVLPGIRELLDRLVARRDVSLGLLTGNYRRGADLKLQHYRLDHHFRFGGFGDEHFERDDVARVALREACRHLDRDVSPEHLCVIGDTPSDIQCARAIGARAVAVATGIYTRDELSAARPDHLFDDFTDPRELLESLV